MSNEYKDWVMDAREEYDAAVACFNKEWHGSLGFHSVQDEDGKYIIIVDMDYGNGIIFNRKDWTYKRLVDCDRP